jgi:hypothetical protein
MCAETLDPIAALLDVRPRLRAGGFRAPEHADVQGDHDRDHRRDDARHSQARQDPGSRPACARCSRSCPPRASAKACGVDELVGTLEPGNYADVFLVEGDATPDIGAIS